MNCKQGELAIVIRSFCGNEGKICLILGPSDEPGLDWLVEFQRPIEWKDGPVGRRGHAYDCNLRPIRDSDGADETLTWAGKPIEVVA